MQHSRFNPLKTRCFCPADFDKAMEDVGKLREMLDNQSFAQPLQQLQQRTWLMHWALFAFWNHENGRNALIDLYFQVRCRKRKDKCALLPPRLAV